MQSIQEKTCLRQTKAWNRSLKVPSQTCLPSLNLSSTHRQDLTASTNSQQLQTHLNVSVTTREQTPVHSEVLHLSTCFPPHFYHDLLDSHKPDIEERKVLPGALSHHHRLRDRITDVGKMSSVGLFEDCSKYGQGA